MVMSALRHSPKPPPGEEPYPTTTRVTPRASRTAARNEQRKQTEENDTKQMNETHRREEQEALASLAAATARLATEIANASQLSSANAVRRKQLLLRLTLSLAMLLLAAVGVEAILSGAKPAWPSADAGTLVLCASPLLLSAPPVLAFRGSPPLGLVAPIAGVGAVLTALSMSQGSEQVRDHMLSAVPLASQQITSTRPRQSVLCDNLGCFFAESDSDANQCLDDDELFRMFAAVRAATPWAPPLKSLACCGGGNGAEPRCLDGYAVKEMLRCSYGDDALAFLGV